MTVKTDPQRCARTCATDAHRKVPSSAMPNRWDHRRYGLCWLHASSFLDGLLTLELSIRGIQRAQFYSDWRATLNMATGEFSVGHVAEPFGNRIGRKMQIERLRWTAITAVQKHRRGAVACRIRVVVLRKFNQRIDRQGGVFTGLDHHIGDKTGDPQPRGRERIPALPEGLSTGRRGFRCGPSRTSPCLFCSPCQFSLREFPGNNQP
jgi:hypothetical protein